MRKKETVQKSVTIIYGNNTEERKRVLQGLIDKDSCQFKESEVDESGKLIVSNSQAKVFFTSCKDIEPLENLISGTSNDTNSFKTAIYTKDSSGKLKEIYEAKIIIENASFSPNDIQYFSKMEHVTLIPCFQ